MDLYSIHKVVLSSYWWLSYLATFVYLACLSLHSKHEPVDRGRLDRRDAGESRAVSSLLLAWNCGLALFSALGSLNTAPHIWGFSSRYGLVTFLCSDPFEIVGEGEWARWSFLFVCSKYLELVDTAFVVWRGRKVTFLHCYHHSSVLVFVWRAFVVKLSSGIIFTSVNYVVHTLMYTYYAQAIVCRRRPAWGIIVTSAQLLQMLIGLATTLCHTSLHLTKAGCESDLPTLCVGIALYSSYLYLFLQFSIDRYFNHRDTRDCSLAGNTTRKED